MSASVRPNAVSRYLNDLGFARADIDVSHGFRVGAIKDGETRVDSVSHAPRSEDAVMKRLGELSEALSGRYRVRHVKSRAYLVVRPRKS